MASQSWNSRNGASLDAPSEKRQHAGDKIHNYVSSMAATELSLARFDRNVQLWSRHHLTFASNAHKVSVSMRTCLQREPEIF